MTRVPLRIAIVGLVVAAAWSPLAAGWGNDAIDEPSSPRYDTSDYMWQFPNDRDHMSGGSLPDRLYFNAQLSWAFASRHVNVPGGRLDAPTLVHADALLGYWRDCNNDGYIGNAATGQKNYLQIASPTPIDEGVCRAGSIFNPVDEPLAPNAPYNQLCCMIHEFVDVGPFVEYPDCARDHPLPRCAPWSVQDDDSRVWGDIGLPSEPWVRHAGFRDAAAENPAPILIFPRGTFDSWNGHLRWIDAVSLGRVSGTYRDATFGGSLYETPLAGAPTPLTQVRYQGYTAGNPDNDWEGRPLVSTWDCSSGAEDPTLGPSVDPGGSVVDSVNHTFMGARATPEVPNPQGGAPIFRAALNVGPGCDGSAGGPQTFNDGLILPHPEDETLPTEDRKVTPEWFFQYRPPLSEPRNQLAAWGVVPRADRTTGGTWYGHQLFFNDGPADTDADYYVFYAKVSTSGMSGSNVNTLGNYPTFLAPGPSGLPGAKVVSGRIVPPVYTYGKEACDSPLTDFNGWDCTNWPTGPYPTWDSYSHQWWGVSLGETYQLRDVDCVDATAANAGVEGAVKDNANALWEFGIDVAFGGEPPTQDVPTKLFTEACQ